MEVGESLPLVVKQVAQSQIEKYALASGDLNPIHVDHEFAAKSQFGGTIAHGMMVAASISEMMTLAFSEDWLQRGRLKIRFRAPVRTGETITAFGKVKRIRCLGTLTELTCSVCVRNQRGEATITGDAIVTVGP